MRCKTNAVAVAAMITYCAVAQYQRLTLALCCSVVAVRLTFVGIENFEETIAVSGSALTVHLHSTHNTDIALAIIGTYKATGIVCRGLVHRTVMLLVPLLKYFGKKREKGSIAVC